MYTTLSDEVSAKYERVKDIVLKAYELVPEAYRQRFRNLKKIPSQTYTEFARLKEQRFDEWRRSRDVDDFPKLRELMLVEEFKLSIPKEIKVHLEESRIEVLDRAAKVADEYALAHKVSFSSGSSKAETFKKESKEGNSSSPPVGNKKDLSCFFCGRKGHIRKDCFHYAKSIREGKPVSVVNSLTSSNFRCFAVI